MAEILTETGVKAIKIYIQKHSIFHIDMCIKKCLFPMISGLIAILILFLFPIPTSNISLTQNSINVVIQSLGTIFALVISMSLIATQITSSSYSQRLGTVNL